MTFLADLGDFKYNVITDQQRIANNEA